MQPLTVAGTLNSLSTIADYVMTAASAVGLDKKASYKLRLAVDEIATNIILYGYQEADREGSLNLQVNVDDQTLSIVIEDTGIAYDPHQGELVDPDDLKLPLEERPIGGLGVFLAIEGVDQFIYERVDDRNRNIFVVNRPRVANFHQS